VIGQMLKQRAQEMGLLLSEENVQAFELYVAELKKWNKKVNLTAITADGEIVVKHIIDSLVFAEHVHDSESVLDIGSGAGLPAIPLKIVKPMISVVSVDAVGKKILFQRHVARLLKFNCFEAMHARVESMLETGNRRFDVITSRAFSQLEQFVVLSAPLLAMGGRMIAMKGPSAIEEIKKSEEILDTLGFKLSAIHSYKLPSNAGERNLIIIARCESA
jgi:16S rRNA (guanine527-N7)-methyltransferase